MLLVATVMVTPPARMLNLDFSPHLVAARSLMYSLHGTGVPCIYIAFMALGNVYNSLHGTGILFFLKQFPCT